MTSEDKGLNKMIGEAGYARVQAQKLGFKSLQAYQEQAPRFEKAAEIKGEAYKQKIAAQLSPGEKPIFGDKGRLVGIDSAALKEIVPIAKYSQSIEQYNLRIPLIKSESIKVGEYKGLPVNQNVKVYVDPITGKKIEDINKYYADYKLLTSSTPLTDVEQMASIVSGNPLDVKGIEVEKQTYASRTPLTYYKQAENAFFTKTEELHKLAGKIPGMTQVREFVKRGEIKPSTETHYIPYGFDIRQKQSIFHAGDIVAERVVSFIPKEQATKIESGLKSWVENTPIGGATYQVAAFLKPQLELAPLMLFDPLLTRGGYAEDIEAFAKRRAKGKLNEPPKQVEAPKYTWKQVKEVLKKNPEKSMEYFRRAKETIKSNPFITEAEKTKQIGELALKQLEIQTGKSLVTESGAVDIGQLSSIRFKPKVPKLPTYKPSIFINQQRMGLGYAQLIPQQLKGVSALFMLQSRQQSKLNILSRTQSKQALSLDTLTIPRTKTDVTSMTIPRTKTDVTSMTIPRTKTDVTSMTIPRTTPKIEEPFKPIPPPPIYTPSTETSIINFLRKKKRRAIFEALSRRKGKEFSLGTYETQTEAEGVLGKYLKRTLAASGRIKAEGRVLPFTSLRSFRGLEFKPGKRDIFKVVQARGFRLGTRAERMEIKRAKKDKLKVW
jgi:hypothetical protein